LSERGAVVEFVGAQTGIEKELVPRAGYALHSLPLTGLAGGGLARARAGLLFLRALARCRGLMREFRPAAVLGVGGYASAPAVVAANALRIPTFLHEQNSVPGRVNRFASRFTTEIFVTFPAAGKHLLGEAAWVGMPTRKELFGASREEAVRHLDLEPPVVLIFGGSGGALRINLAAAEAFRNSTPYTVVQISGRRDFSRLSTDNPHHKIIEYVDDIWRYLAAADVVVSRAGAGSLFDTAAAGRAAVLIPYPYATGDHQLHNARYFTEKGAAELLVDSEVTAQALRERVENLLDDDERREDLARRIRTLATPEAADLVAGRLLHVAAQGGERRP
jgi:UDP-N-acetylglucosamine--N-acetylmuramyl-(pentapeptide) pyrophosphoryl-undecaprenol N-acetylglucosamine transferase